MTLEVFGVYKFQMPFNFFDVELAYANDKNLKKEDVKTLLKWVSDQPHLPEINEAQAILFLQKWHYDKDAAQDGVDSYFTFKTLFPEFLDRNPSKSPLRESFDVAIMTVLPKRTPDGHIIIFAKILDLNADHFHLNVLLKYLDMAILTRLYQENSLDYVIVFDMTDFPPWAIAKFQPDFVKKLWFYLHNVIPFRLKRFHYFNLTSFVDDFVGTMKPFVKKELFDQFYFHESLDDLKKYIPDECLPQDYRGSLETTAVLHEKNKTEFLTNVSLYEWEDKQTVDETRRPQKSTILSDIKAVGLKGSNSGFNLIE